MKTLVIINEPFANMVLGRNTSLAYILSAVKLGHEVYVYNLTNRLPKNRESKISTFHLTSNQALCRALIKNYQKLNQEIADCVAEKNLEKLRSLKIKKAEEFLSEFLPAGIAAGIELESLKISEIDFVIQRLEPMKSPFPPHGKKDVNEVLKSLRKLFPHFVFNCPADLSDKEIPQEINRILKEKIATPTAEFKLEDCVTKPIKSMAQEYQKLYGKKNSKLVFKPKNSAQSLGVFAVEFTKDGLDLAAIKNQTVEELRAAQLHTIKNNLDEEELKKIIEILCYVQNARINKALKYVTRDQVLKIAQELYNAEILVQPFLEGVKSGDVRVNILKNSQGNFYVGGQTFRKSLRVEDKNFTTGYSTGGATSAPITILKSAEIKNLHAKIAQILEILNGPLRKKYRDAIELGADFILVGDGENIFLGEINHHCQALVPISEAMGGNSDYQLGLGLTTRAVRDAIGMQGSLGEENTEVG